jgi:hypothetical protein
MSKPARNAPCPCGSGAKQKYCCGSQRRSSKDRFVSDQVTNSINTLFSDNCDTIQKATETTASWLRASNSALVASCSKLDVGEQGKLIEAHATHLEVEIGNVLQQRSPLFWISLIRRIPSWLECESIRTLPGMEALLLSHIEQNKAQVLVKHSDWAKVDWSHASGALQIKPTSEDVVNLWGVVEPLMGQLNYLPLIYRCVAKGAELTQSPNGDLSAAMDPALAEAVKAYDTRQANYGYTLSPVGIGGAFILDELPDTQEWSVATTDLFMCAPNRNRNLEVSLPKGVGRLKGPSFIPYVLRLQAVYDYLVPFEAKIAEVTGLSLEELKLGLGSLTRCIAGHYYNVGAYTMYSRGIYLATFEHLGEWLEEAIRRRTADGLPATEITRVAQQTIGLLKCDLARAKGWDGLLGRGLGCLFQWGDACVLDLTLLPLVIHDLLFDLHLDNALRQIKGTTFERTVAERLAKDVKDVHFPIKPNLKLKRRGEKDPYAEADVYLQSGTLLFLIDCKAYSRRRGFMKGERQETENRWVLVAEWLKEGDRRAREVAAAPIGANYSVPNEVTHIVAVVCSAIPEFMWETNETTNLTDQIPRVCSYAELVEFLKSFNSSQLDLKPYSFAVTR